MDSGWNGESVHGPQGHGDREQQSWEGSGKLSSSTISFRICLQCRRPGFDPWMRKIPWRREWLPTPVFLPGEIHGQRSRQATWGYKESDTTERLTLYRSRGIVSTAPTGAVVSSPSSFKEGTNVNPISTGRVSKNWRPYF